MELNALTFFVIGIMVVMGVVGWLVAHDGK